MSSASMAGCSRVAVMAHAAWGKRVVRTATPPGARSAMAAGTNTAPAPVESRAAR
ncbi:hypothetical protein [Brevundimonas denitrificans]|uniref:hypothetical protein n=1 Tax=Brevundimonas denitrificans TaxID=1443434 RepID=UPI00352CCCE0